MADSTTDQVLVLGCAKDARHLLGPALEQLAARGLAVEVVSGIETRDDGLLASASRRGDAGYLLFPDLELTSARLERLRTRLLEAGVQPHRVVVMPPEWRGAIEIIERAQRMGLRVGPRRATLVTSVPDHPGAPSPAVELPHPGATVAAFAGSPSGTVPVDRGPHTDAHPLVVARALTRRPVQLAALVAAGVALLVTTVAIASGPSQTAQTAAPLLSHLAEHIPTTAAPAAPVPVAASVAAPVAAPTVLAMPVPAPPTMLPPPPPATAAVPEEPTIIAADAPAEPVIDEAEMQAIYGGLVARKFRALDILLVSAEPPKKKGKRILKGSARMTFAQAKAYCDALDVGGVAQWRLPRVGELGSLTANSMLADGKFWSATEGDTFGSMRVVWNSDHARMGTAPQRWKGGRVVCVRTLAKPPTPAAAP
ncbi:MAG: DUF1566 domain-containing protein [Deltaproteobacteria bacterium]|nr:DUF1566 domain-containing protein [Deltaproteobacteria bacterium]MBK8234545.1 DUF1566 domain-containing protein [Deltaproteobacteria bacterium]MBK8715287.1 DUF1566 domain-containing protein [Deltaproteobacteria bacterium]